MQWPGRRALLAGCAALTLWTAPAAHAAWTAPSLVSEAGVGARVPQIGLDAAGNATLVWETATGTIRSAYRPAGGAWQPSAPRMPAISGCASPELAVNAAGTAIVVADCATAPEIRAAYRAASGLWSSAVTLPGSGPGADPHVGLDGAGNATAVWTSGSTVQSGYRPAAGPWGAAIQVSPAGDLALEPQLAVTANGAALAIWRHDLDRTPTDAVVTVETSLRRGLGPWSTPAVLTQAATSTVPVAEDQPQVRWNAGGDRVAVWANQPPGARALLQKRWGTGGDFGAWGGSPVIQDASDGVRDVEAPQVGLAADGGAVAVWRAYDPGAGNFRPQAATTERINGAWSVPVTLADAEIALAEPQVAVAPSGRAAAVWRPLATGISAATRPPGAAFLPATTISTPGASGADDPRVVMSAAGDAVATWAESGAGAARIAVAVDDVTPPALSAVSVPAGVATGAPAAMSAAATDAWSPVSLRWSLGDGTSVTGAALAHAYATPGTRTVTVTATDAAGNTATQTRAIVVSAPPVAAPPAPPGGAPGRAAPLPVTLAVSVPRQPWRAIRKARAVRLRCALDVAGSCSVAATMARALAKRLKLKPGRRALRVGTRRVAIARGDRPVRVKVALPREARRAIARTRRRVALTLTVTGRAPGRAPATLTRKLIVRR